MVLKLLKVVLRKKCWMKFAIASILPPIIPSFCSKSSKAWYPQWTIITSNLSLLNPENSNTNNSLPHLLKVGKCRGNWATWLMSTSLMLSRGENGKTQIQTNRLNKDSIATSKTLSRTCLKSIWTPNSKSKTSSTWEMASVQCLTQSPRGTTICVNLNNYM